MGHVVLGMELGADDGGPGGVDLREQFFCGFDAGEIMPWADDGFPPEFGFELCFCGGGFSEVV